MILKIKSHKRAVFGKILDYMLNSKDRLMDAKGNSFVITHNLKGTSIQAWEKQYKDNELTRLRHRKGNTILTHEIISWHRDDTKYITLEKMEDMAREYIRARNPNGIYVAVPHFDKQHYHVHICASGIEYKTGKSLRLSKAAMHKLKVDIQNYQVSKFPELSKSIVAHGKNDKARVTDKEYQYKLRTRRETNKEHVSAMLKTCYKKANSKETFFELLKECGVKTYERSGKVTGIIHENIKFRFSHLGFTEELFKDLDKTNMRGRELKGMRVTEADNTIQVKEPQAKALNIIRDTKKGKSRTEELDNLHDEKNDKSKKLELER